MKALVLLGSPRRAMNTDFILDCVIGGLIEKNVEVEKIFLRNMSINHCVDCKACAKTGHCIIDDDMKLLYPKLDEADIIILGSPLYFNSVSSITKTMIDRCEAFWCSKYLLKKSSIDRNKKRKGMFVCTAGSKADNHQFKGATLVADLFFKSVNAEYTHNILIDNTDEKNTKKREKLIEIAYNNGKEIVDELDVRKN
ncbi:flavodoxin family protein [Anaeromicrobium sediminis]|uniref:NADPH-dependent FMN reductase n=1 Tax=Anaeromicrobium sediminis TaxID=1478221 RepID=A0A267MI14_9FIRM|nr:flavodoxin family protein [Anaeromicrobium sediminis]PAB59221.1 NADPH-dependent FMN reductase [Anaeromicrobium sediminis]